MVVWLNALPLLMIEQARCCNSSSPFYVLIGVFVLETLLWLYLLPGSVHYLTISFTCLIRWSSSSYCLMLTAFNVCLDWRRTWPSRFLNKLLLVFAAESHASLQHNFSLYHLLLLKIRHSCRSSYIFVRLLSEYTSVYFPFARLLTSSPF